MPLYLPPHELVSWRYPVAISASHSSAVCFGSLKVLCRNLFPIYAKGHSVML
ncbi:hypothetical protein HBI56_029510 [Parastagonospora nodorum]|uniref:Uncharacterized protein n=1 Tax=Phaeosphaeria nodorum (strain SN15 / ATCC MYA-4574 / FGSC 10173) TaxID=321614 RepID=A0A7U2HYB4_PHANO|nr:hypothetical protein HBH56_017120 [Parastagonospora nodorum]QRC95158.1 hypothetical protein JI435_406930 [Parastagonospora nodorum SN15]KAH3937349.1 hypothetical protein HBH54_017350 [Parastagonospora nodorum]KAH3953816.1 hypothetical protein HBH53_029720 [Parastagonospora nodorum]KAH3962671.1 hypothetical protein HBH51_172260 [Parastagonospora nodorum]